MGIYDDYIAASSVRLTPATFPINCEKSRLFILIRGRARGA